MTNQCCNDACKNVNLARQYFHLKDLFGCTRIRIDLCVLKWIGVKNFHPNPLRYMWIEVNTSAYKQSTFSMLCKITITERERESMFISNTRSEYENVQLSLIGNCAVDCFQLQINNVGSVLF